MNAAFPLSAPRTRPARRAGFTAGSLAELAVLGVALLVPAAASAQSDFGDFGPDPGATANVESRGYGREDLSRRDRYRPRDARPVLRRPAYRDDAPAYRDEVPALRDPVPSYREPVRREEPAGRTAPRATPKPVPTAAERVSYRYGDPQVVRFATRSGWNTLVELYQESSRLIDARHHQPNRYSDRVAKALENLSEAVGNPEFRTAHRLTADAGRVAAFRQSLESLGRRPVSNMRDAIAAMGQAAGLAERDLDLAGDAVAAEFLYGAVESLDRFSGFTPENARTGYGAELTVVPAKTAAGPDTSVVGLGVELKEHEKGVVVVKPIAGGPAARGGVKRGDVIIAVDGRSLEGRGLNAAADLIVGREGTPVRLTVLRDGRTGTFTLTRARVELRTVSVVELMTAADGTKVGYLKLDRFAATSDRELDAALWELYQGGMKALVMDLRGNPGGLLDQAISISDKFLPAGTIVSTRGRLAEDNTSSAARKERTWKVPMAVIVDDGSASASEIFAAAIQDNGRGLIVGRQSYGKGTVQTHFPVRSVPGNLKLTTAMFYSPAGRRMADAGVAPDVEVTEDAEILPLDRDADVAAALAAAAGRTAAAMAANPGSAR